MSESLSLRRSSTAAQQGAESRERRALPVLNNSRAKTFRLCNRKHYYAYVLGLRPVAQSKALHFGTVFHLGLEAWWRWQLEYQSLQRRDWDESDSALVAALVPIEASDLDPFDVVRAVVLMTVYHERWIDDPYEVIGVESTFVAPLVNPSTGARSRTWDLGGTLDVLVRRFDTRELFTVEHKTSSEDLSPESDYWMRLRMDSQISTYMTGARQLTGSGDVAGCIYDVIGKPHIKPLLATPADQRKYTKEKKCSACKGLGGRDDSSDPRGYVTCSECEGEGKIGPRLYANQREHDETTEEFRGRLVEHILSDPTRYIRRADVVRLEHEEREAAADTWIAAKNISSAQRSGFHPRNPDACHLYRRTCEYWQVCIGQADIHDTAMFRPTEETK